MSTRQRASAERVAITTTLTLLSLTLLSPAHASGAAARQAGMLPIYIGQTVPLTGIFATSVATVYQKAGA
jgi:hypothetical protein